jgi:hypothetical protein
MRRIASAVLVGFAFALALSAGVLADTKTITGEVIDIQCHTKRGDNGKGEAHAGCATGCAKKGAAMGILTSDGVYTIAGDYTKDNNAKLVEFVAKNVTATGEVSEKDGQKTIAVASMALAK